MKKIILAPTLFMSYSVLASAKCTEGDVTKCITDAGGIINSLNTSIVTALGTLFLAASVVGFLLGVVRFIWAQQQGDEKGVKTGKETLKWGVIALFCAFSIYGIIKFMQNTLLPGGDPSTIVVPKIKIEGGNGSGAGANSSGRSETVSQGSGAGANSSGRSETSGGTGVGSQSSGAAEKVLDKVKFGPSSNTGNDMGGASPFDTSSFESGAGGSTGYSTQASDISNSIDGSVELTQPAYNPQAGE